MFRRLISTRSLSNCRQLVPQGVWLQSTSGTSAQPFGGCYSAPRALLGGSTQKKFFSNDSNCDESNSAPEALSNAVEASISQPDPAFKEFNLAFGSGRTNDEFFVALSNYCSRASPPTKEPFWKTLRTTQVQQDPVAISRILRLGLEHGIHLTPYTYRATLASHELDPQLLLDLSKHEFPVNHNAACVVFHAAVRATYRMLRTDARFPTLVHQLHAFLPDIRSRLLPERRADVSNWLSRMLAQIEEYDAVLELLRSSSGHITSIDGILTQMCFNLQVDRAVELFNIAPHEFDVERNVATYAAIIHGISISRGFSALLPVMSSFVREVQSDERIFISARTVAGLARVCTNWPLTEVENKQAVLLLRLLFNAVVVGRGNVGACAGIVGEALRVLGDSDGAVQLFEAREDWASVDKSVPFFDLPVDPSIEAIVRPWLEKPLVNEASIDTAIPATDAWPNTPTTATTQAQILIARGRQDEVFDLLKKYPQIDQYSLVRDAVDKSGVEAGLRMLNDIERATHRRACVNAAFPVLVWYFKNNQDAEADAILAKMRRHRLFFLDEDSHAGNLLFDAMADVGRGDLADQMFDALRTDKHWSWCNTAAYTLCRWYRENKLERFDALTHRCLEEVGRDGPLPPRLWRAIAVLNRLLGDRETAVSAALQHDAGPGSHQRAFTLETMVKLVQFRVDQNKQFLFLFDQRLPDNNTE